MTKSFWIPGPLPGMNEIIKAAKGYGGRGTGYAIMKKDWSHRVKYEALAQGVKPMDKVEIEYEWTEKDRRRDPSNIAAGMKFVEDGLVLAGILPNDGQKNVLKFSHQFTEPSKESPGVRVTLTTEENE